MMAVVYAAYHKNSDEIEHSSSGGIFTALSDAILDLGGKIVAAVYNYSSHDVEHIVCSIATERDACRGSKYIQSRISRDIYFDMDRLLKEGVPILFVGTPCQVAGIKSYVKNKGLPDNELYTCDLICHGVGSPSIWKSFINKKNANYITFKDKRKGWKNPICIGKCDKKEFSLRGYSWLYFSNLILRPACYECCYTSTTREGDFTIGDFWKVKLKTPEMYNPRGTSFLMVNTEKGIKMFERVKRDIIFKEIFLEDVLQHNMMSPTYKPSYRESVFADFGRMKPTLFFCKWQWILLAKKLKMRIAKR